ncbi:MAG TPA: hypothetical protein PKY77_04150 [Phycisphaerae bacterium]|nr:hypothetical protein [Phycisphaerae bacterium]HRY67035.1 hypothetical protein [Phycisphaerae bacterium]HSA27732.1 hypothetical protein [Phycisphaerae bacterium]
MVDLQIMIDRVVSGANFLRQLCLPGWHPSMALAAGMAIVAGLATAMWGARLLRAFFVLGFMVAGAAVGVYCARRLDIELLVGLVLGAGVLGLIGHFLYRWWVGVGTGLFAALVVVMVGTPWIWSEVESFSDSYLKPGSGIRIAGAAEGAAAPGQENSAQFGVATSVFWRAFGAHLWAQKQAELRRLAVLAGIAGLLGLVLGLILPRFTTVMGTSVIGVGSAVTGGAVLLIRNQRTWWDAMLAKPGWFLGAVGLTMLLAFVFQIRHRRGAIVPAQPAVPVATA